MNTESTILISMIMGALGVGYIVYGRNQMKASALVAGLLLCIYPYFIHNLFLNILIGVALLAAPFFVDD